MTDKSLKDLMDQTVEIPMKKGKKAVLGPMNLETLCWVTEKFESLEKFQSLFEDQNEAFKNLSSITEFVFQLLENQDDFKDVRDFRRNFSFHAIGDLTDAMVSIINGSMPDVSAESGAQGESESESEGK